MCFICQVGEVRFGREWLNGKERETRKNIQNSGHQMRYIRDKLMHDIKRESFH
jgi:hypothetical protein